MFPSCSCQRSLWGSGSVNCPEASKLESSFESSNLIPGSKHYQIFSLKWQLTWFIFKNVCVCVCTHPGLMPKKILSAFPWGSVHRPSSWPLPNMREEGSYIPHHKDRPERQKKSWGHEKGKGNPHSGIWLKSPTRKNFSIINSLQPFSLPSYKNLQFSRNLIRNPTSKGRKQTAFLV